MNLFELNNISLFKEKMFKYNYWGKLAAKHNILD